MKKITTAERLGLLDEAQEHIHNAARLIREALNGLPESEYFNRTLVASLEIAIDEGGWLTRDPNLGNIREYITEEEK